MTSGPLTGALLDERYRVADIVGAGGFGTVYAATHVRLGGKVAIKVPVVQGGPSDAAEAIGRFVEEGRMLKRLRHPNIAAALDVGLLPADEAGRTLPYLVLEWCSGPTLKDWRKARAGMLAPTEVWPILRPVFEAIAHAHERGIAHRDIKPANVLLESARGGGLHPRVIDFGIAKVLGGELEGSSGVTRTSSSRNVFTPTYAAPEQLLGLRTGPPTDVFALALLLLEVIGGKRVFPDERAARLALFAKEVLTPRHVGLDLGPWNDVIARAMSRRSSERYGDARAFLRALGDPPTRFDAVEPDERAVDARDAATVRDGRPRAVAGEVHHADRSPAVNRPEGSAAPRSGSLTPLPVRELDAGGEAAAPSSRTLRTRSPQRIVAAEAAPRAWAAATPAVGALLVAGGALVLFVALLARDATEAPRAPPERAPRVSAPPAPASRPIYSLQAREIVQRAEAAGMADCRVVLDDDFFREVRCGAGWITVDDNRAETDTPDDRLWTLHALQAKARKREGDVRFAIGDGAGVAVVSYPPLVDDVALRVLDGIRHGGVQSSRGVPEPRIGARLSQWTGEELVARLAAIGARIAKETRVLGFTSVRFRLDGAYGVLAQERKPEYPVSTMLRPFVYAEDGVWLLTLRGDEPLVTAALLTKILDETAVTSRGEYR